MIGVYVIPSLEHGFESVLAGFVTFLVLGVLLNVLFRGAGVIIFLLLSILSLVGEAEKMKYWSSSYLLGYLMGQALIMRVMPDAFSLIAIILGTMILLSRIIGSFPE